MTDALSHPGSRPSRSPVERRPSQESQRSFFGRGMNLGKIFGIRVTLDISLLVIAFLVTFNLGAGLLPAWHPDWSWPLIWGVALAAAFLFIASILAHELSHAIVGRRVGVPIDAITLFLFGGMAHMGAEPQRPRAEFLTAVVGPLTSLAIGVGATFLGLWLGPTTTTAAEIDVAFLQQFGPVATLLLWLGPINILLGLFNLVPGFPLDGGRVLRSAIWWATDDFQKATRWSSFAGQGIAWLLIGSGILMMFGYRIPVFGAGLVPGLWMILLGWFLNYAARRSYEQVVLQGALQNIPIRRFMLSRLEPIPPMMTLSEFVYDRLLHSDQRCFPVLDDDRFIGLACLSDARKVPETEWDRTRVSTVMTPAARLSVLRPDDDASVALRVLAEREVDQVPIVERGQLLGLVRRQDVLKWVSLRSGSEAP